MPLLRYFHSVFAALLFVLLSAVTAHALDNSEYTESEKAGFAFYYFAKTDPDFEKWIMEYNYFKAAKPSKKNLILYEDKMRLSKGLQTFDPKTDYIGYSTPARIHFSTKKKRQEYLKKYNKIPVRIELPRILEIPGSQEKYFSFYVGGTWFAIIPQNFQNFTTIYMDEEEFYDIYTRLEIFDPNETFVKANIAYKLRATSADTQSPFPIGSNNFWLTMAEVGSIVINDKNNKTTFWQYEASWFITKTRKDLMNLYKE